MKRFTEDHEWVEIVDGVAIIGITDHAQAELGDIVFVDLPEIGAQFIAGEEAAVVESVKAAGEVNCPVGGEVVEINEALIDEPGLVNSAAESDGWIIKLALDDEGEVDSLLDEAAYQAYIGDHAS